MVGSFIYIIHNDFGGDYRMKNDWIIKVGMASLFACFLTFIITFYMAYFNPDGSKSVMVYIDLFSEANIEIVVVSIMLIFGTWTFIRWYRE